MVAWLVWVQGWRGLSPQIAFDVLDTATEKSAAAIHPLHPEDEERIRLGANLDDIVQSYPAPIRHDDHGAGA